jgi:glycine C-acetyltransferase
MPPNDRSSTPRRFEDFLPRDGTEDLLAKTEALDDFLAAAPQEYLEGLGLQSLGPAAARARFRDRGGREFEGIHLASNSYLSLTTDPEVVEASRAACAKYGYGTGAVSLYGGITDLHRALEERIARLYGTEDAIVFPSGYSANVGVLSALCGPGDVTLHDAANHASIFDGARLSGADIRVYLHRNTAHLEKLLRRLPPERKGRLIVTDGVFSMDGDLAPLDRIVELAARYGARVMVDEAHALGVVGPTGRGTPERFGCAGRVDVIAGTLSKTPGAIGGYCAGRRALIQYLRYYARTYFFSTSLPAPVVAGLNVAFDRLLADTAGRDALWRNIRHLSAGLRRAGFDLGDTESAILPVRVGDETKLARFHRALRERGVFTNLVTYPAVRRKECRLRVSVMNALTTADLDRALAAFEEAGRAGGVLGSA